MASFRRLKKKYIPFLPEGSVVRHWRNKLLRKLRLARTYEPAIFLDRPELRYGSVLPPVIAEQVLRQGELTFLQIGAYDGVVGDAILELIERYPLRGVLVEPQPSAFARLKKLHGNNDRLMLVNAAIDRKSGRRSFFVPAEGDAEFASLDRQHLLRHGLHAHEIVEIEVDCLTIDDVLQRAQCDTVDFLQIDAEGYDYEIIKSIDFHRLKPRILRFEYRHFPEQELTECLLMLGRHGYRFLTEKLDLIAIQVNDEARGSTVRTTAA